MRVFYWGFMAIRYDIFTTPADGEVLLDERMSADWSALQVQIVPINAYVSWFEDDTYLA